MATQVTIVTLNEATARDVPESSVIGQNAIASQGLSVSASTSSITTTTSTNISSLNEINIYLSTETKNVLEIVSLKDNSTLDSESFYRSLDLICEGPIEGLVDSDGNLLNYLDLDSSENKNQSSLAYGVYYNDVSVKDKKTGFLNLSAADFTLALGNEVNNFNGKSSSIYSYQSRVYDLDFAPNIPSFNGGGFYPFLTQQFQEINATSDQLELIYLKNKARVFSHYIKNNYTTSATVNISVNNCFYIGGKGDTYSNNIRFVVCVTNLTSRNNKYFYFQGYFVAKSNPVMIPIEIDFKRSGDLSSDYPEYIINVYSVEKRITAAGEKNSTNSMREFSVDSIIERVDYAFSYPYSTICSNYVSAKHFANIPVRSFDCKLLKIKIPENYDPDVREYDGDWNGNFSKVLKWTDNPAWIFYDLCVNARYGLAKSSMNENDINKWELLKISKFCDELVKTNASTKYEPQTFTYNNNIKVNEKDYNTITIDISSTETLASFRLKYPEKGILFLYDIKDEFGEYVNVHYKKIILSATIEAGKGKLKLCNDFGVRKFIESDSSGRFYDSLRKYILGNSSVLNTEDNAKSYAISYIDYALSTVTGFNSANQQASLSITQKKIFDSSFKIKSGYCVAKHANYYDFLEPRFTANIYINDATEGLKILTDLSSVFRGVFYFRNGLLNLTTDVKKSVVYVFTNSNVKDGQFNYTSSNLENTFTVAKVSYSDKTDNFKDKVTYVEDADLIKKYGIIEKEILGFGITSRYQAERIGKWLLATGKLESQTVTFTTGIEATNLKIGDIIRIADNLKFSKLQFGRVVSLDFKNNIIYVDRELSQDIIGKKIKIFSIVNDEPLESVLSIFSASSADMKIVLFEKDYFSWNVVSGITVSNYNQKLSAISSLALGWNKKVYTNQSYTKDCSLQFSLSDLSSESAIGLSEVYNITTDETDIYYQFRIAGNGFQVYINNSAISGASGYINITDTLSIIYHKEYISFYKNQELVHKVQRLEGNPLYGLVAFKTLYASIYNISFSQFPYLEYGKFSNLRSDANFSIYLEDASENEDLYRIIGINESATNDYGISCMKYSNEKFDIIDEDKYVEPNQNVKKQIIFSTDEYIRPAFNDTISSQNCKLINISYVEAIKNNFDYSFLIESEVLTSSFNQKIYQYVEIDFITLFSYLANNAYVYGLYCTIIKDGKILKFKINRNQQSKITVFLGENRYANSVTSTISFDIDIYAFDSNMKLINV